VEQDAFLKSVQSGTTAAFRQRKLNGKQGWEQETGDDLNQMLSDI